VLLGFVLLWLAVAVGDAGTLVAVGVPIFLAAVLLAFVGLSAMLRRGDCDRAHRNAERVTR
jgi:hypothetical protein